MTDFITAVLPKQRFKTLTLRKLPEILTLYYWHGMTIKEVAKVTHVSPRTISNLLKEYGRGLH